MRVRTMVVWVMAVIVLGSAACTVNRRGPRQEQPPTAGWQLLEPPQEANDRYPRGYRVLSDAPLEQWQPQGSYASFEACTKAVREREDRFIDSAHAAVGNDAKNDLAVRRAVHAKCVQLQPGAAPSPAKR